MTKNMTSGTYTNRTSLNNVSVSSPLFACNGTYNFSAPSRNCNVCLDSLLPKAEVPGGNNGTQGNSSNQTVPTCNIINTTCQVVYNVSNTTGNFS